MSIAFLHVAAASHRSYLNFILPTSRLDRSITLSISLNSSFEFYWITSPHCLRALLSIDSSVRMEERPGDALNGVWTSWLMSERKRSSARTEFSSCFFTFSSSCCDRHSFLFPRLTKRMKNTISMTIDRMVNQLQQRIVFCLFKLSSPFLSIW